MNRRKWLASLAISSVAAGISLATRHVSAEPMLANLEETLKFSLKCRRPEEFAFVTLVVQKVQQKRITRELVLSTLQWAVDRRPEFPFPYFQAGIKKRAAAIGVQL